MKQCSSAQHAHASVLSACPGVNNGSCPAPPPPKAEILLVRRACKQCGSCPQPVVLKHTQGPVSLQSSWRRTMGMKEERGGGDPKCISLASLDWGQSLRPRVGLQQCRGLCCLCCLSHRKAICFVGTSSTPNGR